MKRVIPLLAILLAFAACTPLPAFPVPPPLPAEVIPLPPVSDQVLLWQPGDWIYFGGSYRYEAGRYVPSADHGSSWTSGHWEGAQGQYAWVTGHWN